jgi:hypothetical protein
MVLLLLACAAPEEPSAPISGQTGHSGTDTCTDVFATFAADEATPLGFAGMEAGGPFTALVAWSEGGATDLSGLVTVEGPVSHREVWDTDLCREALTADVALALATDDARLAIDTVVLAILWAPGVVAIDVDEVEATLDRPVSGPVWLVLATEAGDSSGAIGTAEGELATW